MGESGSRATHNVLHHFFHFSTFYSKIGPIHIKRCANKNNSINYFNFKRSRTFISAPTLLHFNINSTLIDSYFSLNRSTTSSGWTVHISWLSIKIANTPTIAIVPTTITPAQIITVLRNSHDFSEFSILFFQKSFKSTKSTGRFFGQSV